MKNITYMGYQLEYLHFVNKRKLKSLGAYPLFVHKKLSFKPATRRNNVSHNSRYGLLLATEDGQYQVVMMVSNQEFNRVKRGMNYGTYSIVSSKNGKLRAVKATNSAEACQQISKKALTQLVTIVLIFMFLIALPIVFFALPLLSSQFA